MICNASRVLQGKVLGLGCGAWGVGLMGCRVNKFKGDGIYNKLVLSRQGALHSSVCPLLGISMKHNPGLE